MNYDPMDPYAEIRSHPELVLISVLESTLSRMVDSLMATHPELCVYPLTKSKISIRVERLIGCIWELQEALRNYRDYLRKEEEESLQDSLPM